MTDLLCEIRFADDPTNASPGRLQGVLVAYGQQARYRRELFTDNALAWAANGLIINEQHNRQAPIVRAFPYVENRELLIDVVLPNSQRGRDAALGVKDGLYTGLSVGFVRATVKDRYINGVREIRYAMLDHGALVDHAEYAGSTVEIRQSEGGVQLPSARTLWL